MSGLLFVVGLELYSIAEQYMDYIIDSEWFMLLHYGQNAMTTLMGSKA
ncbi:hypothetical protein [Shewanella nanhaiensis]|uniref:Uncharacterized protein n=1 Tax=Shewanella nanhaiensis TaxID=2864872 RepID=A0ABS7E0Z5_9GAMM|nr:hypothetical protein [Shewanella nanhaiensis]MBW8183289.1 hypothetical protein [Shewanella nanhaiensis]